jgi:hypothetical protein
MTATPDKLKFDLWYEKEKEIAGWWESLPPCPKRLCVENGKPQKPKKDDNKWKDPKIPSYAELALHPETEWSMRSVTDSNGHANQCTYYVENGEAKLFLTLPSAGTVDWREEATFPHYLHDVEPIYMANYLDNNVKMSLWPWSPSISKNIGTNMKKYFEVRPLHAE